MSILKKSKSLSQPELISELYRKIDDLEMIIRDDNKMKRDLLDVFQENNYNNKDLMLRKIKLILDPEREVNNAI